jgi:hypothetical protein
MLPASFREVCPRYPARFGKPTKFLENSYQSETVSVLSFNA